MADDPLAWAQGRRVALRPDGARRSFDPAATCLLRTAAERRRFTEALPGLYARARAHIEQGGGPW